MKLSYVKCQVPVEPADFAPISDLSDGSARERQPVPQQRQRILFLADTAVAEQNL